MPQWLQLLLSCSLSSLSRSSSLAELASTARKQTNKQTCQKQLRPTQSPAHRTAKSLDFTVIPPFNRLGNTFPKKLMRITWIISRLGVQRRSCRSGFCFARGRLPALLSVSSGSCGLWCFLPVVIESDQFSLMTRTQIVMLWLSCYGFLIKDVTTVTRYNHYKLLCLQKKKGEITVFLLGRKSFRIRKKFLPYCLKPLMKRFCREEQKGGKKS